MADIVLKSLDLKVISDKRTDTDHLVRNNEIIQTTYLQLITLHI